MSEMELFFFFLSWMLDKLKSMLTG